MRVRKTRVLLVASRDESMPTLRTLAREMASTPFEVRLSGELETALKRLAHEAFDAVAIEWPDKGDQGELWLHALQSARPGLPVIALAVEDTAEESDALGKGASDCLILGELTAEALGRSVRYALDRSRAEIALRASEERYHAFIQTLPDIVYSVDGQGRFTFVNDAVKDLGYDPGELVGRHFREIIHPRDVPNVSRKLVVRRLKGQTTGNERAPKLFDERRTRDRKTRELEIRLRPREKNGERFGILGFVGDVSASGLYDGDVQTGDAVFLGTVGVIRDITQRKRMEEALRESLESVRRMADSAIRIISKAVQTKDLYTAAHEQRVADLAVAIARELGLPEETVQNIKVASLIHDVGKLCVPAEILSKPGHLSSAETALIQTHAEKGYEIVKDADFPGPVAETVYQHHERWDGSGYPRSLKGAEIIMEARILSVADVVEAMTYFRPYRPGLGIEKALAEIEDGRSARYDAQIADACLDLFREGRFDFKPAVLNEK